MPVLVLPVLVFVGLVRDRLAVVLVLVAFVGVVVGSTVGNGVGSHRSPSPYETARSRGGNRRGGVRLDRTVDWVEIARILEDAYLQVAPKRLAARSVVRVASSRRDEIASLVEEYDVDLVMLSAEIQQAGTDVFLGSLVEDLIAASPTTVAMLATPGGWGSAGERRAEPAAGAKAAAKA